VGAEGVSEMTKARRWCDKCGKEMGQDCGVWLGSETRIDHALCGDRETIMRYPAYYELCHGCTTKLLIFLQPNKP
jgi:hypothetical protein